jgi:hypothetical protein
MEAYMKSRQTLIVAACVILPGGMLWMVHDRAAAPANPVVRTETAAGREPVPTMALATPVAAPALAGKTAPMVHVDRAGDVKYVARGGDTLSQLAIAMLGSDSKEHRDAVVAANPSLKADPDHVETGQTYSLPLSAVQSGDDVSSGRHPDAVSTGPDAVEAKAAEPTTQPASAAKPASVVGAGPQLKYTARTGDTVSGLASELLGGDTRANRAGIVAGNASLQQDPDHLVAGQSYTIVARNGLAADPGTTAGKPPTTQPDADEAVLAGTGRTLRYTAKSGDTVSKLAALLLGSDTAANREVIIKSNPSLKKDPDHLVAGQTYWITAPIADSMK